MHGFGTFLLIFGSLSALLSLVMCFFCNVKLGEPETEEDIIQTKLAMKFYRIIFWISLAILVIGLILRLI